MLLEPARHDTLALRRPRATGASAAYYAAATPLIMFR